MAAADPGEQKYFFFRDLSVYQTHEKEAKEKEAIEQGDGAEVVSLCKNVKDEENIWNEKIQNTCEQFIKYFIFCSKNGNTMGVQKEDYYIEYFNYWLNDKLRSHVELSENRSKIYKHFENFFNGEVPLSKLKNKINNIQDNYYNKMNSMYKLYDNYNKIKNVDDNDSNKQKNCLDYANNCVTEYSKYISECYNKKDDKFCEALKEFEYIYTTSKYNFKGCKTINLPRLPEFKNAEGERNVKSLDKFSPCNAVEQNSEAHRTEGEYEKDALLSELNLLKTYEKFNSNSYLSEYNEYCSDEIQSTENCKLYTLCARIETNLKGLSKMESSINDNDRCLYFTYWVYDQIHKTFSNNYIVHIPDIYKLFKVIYKINHTLQGKNQCNIDYNHNVKVEELKEMKYLRDYFMNFNSVRDNQVCFNGKRQTCCDYARHINKIYKKYIGNCCTCYFLSGECKNNCNDYFSCDDEYNPYELYKKFECNKLQKDKEAFEEVRKPTAIDYYAISLIALKSRCTTLFCDLFYMVVLASFAFTPLGSRFHKKVINKKKFQNHIREEGMWQTTSSGSTNKQKNPNNKRIRLAYQSAG
ncbi:unnamed protein product [Plasmodium vivax]|uniref:(malaria parasite P. vivax) hypothetical protein n=1 Tax=Plasmodium vivax TaxID=5855 RepID=A0A8S4HHS9_PLAVI|nr:unnamed protein product [Plasmodium vivax]